MSFEVLNKLAFALFAVLSGILLFLPEVIFWLFGIEGSASSEFMMRRAAILFMSLSVLAFVTSETENDEMRQVVSLTFAVALLGMAAMGLFELLRGDAGLGILLAVVVEVIAGFYYIRFWRD
ncbi:hypothetical protein [uncultured Litoreibacter sp.]|uniref:hypothetical protein n=1 Tax=uncultured Litoreibacter sp. TaxID=1392394 RepID=UPI0026233591|nr:hypothetical protein [uncultured Litoreibacter sp.]